MLLCVVGVAAGCQGEDGLSLTPPGLDLGKGQADRAGSFEPCSELPREAEILREIIEAVNAERARHNLRPLRVDQTLMQMADFWACRMIEDGFFGHEDPYDGSTVDSRAVNFGYAFYKIGENLAAGHDTASEVLGHWMRSPGHRANILDEAFVEIGIAAKRGGEYGIYWVQEFGRPITGSPEPTSAKPGEGGSAEDSAPEPSSQPVPEDTGMATESASTLAY